MKKRAIATITAVILLLAASAACVLAATDGNASASPNTLDFASVESKVRANDFTVRSLQENIDMLGEIDYDTLIDDLRKSLNGLADMQMMLLQYGGDNYTLDKLETQYDALEEQFDNIKSGKTQSDNDGVRRQLETTQRQLISAAETMFVSYKSLELSDSALARQKAALERSLAEMMVRENYGQISSLTLAELENGLDQLSSGKATLEMNMDNLLMQLESMTGYSLGSDITLGSVPEVSASELSAMDLESDLAAAKAASYELYDADKTLEQAQKDYKEVMKDNGYDYSKLAVKQAQHTWQTAQYSHDASVLNFELKFRTAYNQIRDYEQALESAKKSLEFYEAKCAAKEIEYSYGNISENALRSARDELSDAQEAVLSASYELFTAYRVYYYAVNYGILN